VQQFAIVWQHKKHWVSWQPGIWVSWHANRADKDGVVQFLGVSPLDSEHPRGTTRCASQQVVHSISPEELGKRGHSVIDHIPSGKRLHNYGQSPFLMGKSTISMAIFNSFLHVYQRVLT